MRLVQVFVISCIWMKVQHASMASWSYSDPGFRFRRMVPIDGLITRFDLLLVALAAGVAKLLSLDSFLSAASPDGATRDSFTLPIEAEAVVPSIA